MLKKYFKIIPYLLLALIVTGINAFLDGLVNIRIMEMLDLAIAGRMDAMKQGIPQLLIMAFLLVPLGILVGITSSFYKRKANTAIKKYYLKKVFAKNIAEFQKDNNAKYLSSMTNDFNVLEMNLINGVFAIFEGIMTFIVGIWLLSTIDPKMLILAFLLIAVNLLISILSSKPIKKANKERSDLFDNYTSYIKEILSAFHIVKNYNLQKRVTDDYNKKSEEIQQKGFIIERMFSFIVSTQNMFMRGSMFGVITVVGYFAAIGKVSTGGLLLVVSGIQRMTWPLFNTSEYLPKLFTSSDLIRKMEKALENSNTYVETVDLSEFQDEIVLSDVEFSYEDSEQIILSDINLRVKKNGKYLVVGPSGGGKSTLLKLFRKYFNPTGGTITINGYNLKDVKTDQYYRLIGNIEQQVFIFEDTIRNNLTLYKEYSDEEINKAINDSGLTDFISQLPDGLDTIIYDNGKNISGGERSRLVIARALLSKASILLMDEAFASLDMERAREIEKTILNLKDMTVINVSHIIFNDTKHLYDRVITVKKTIY
ncbi:MAG: ABC transporter ATP-binding protein [Clostridiales bacterium]|jgi:ABC-type multidrug transport system fused ATPase/permease subunit|nr:ABC transporter ATP-binding protein [Clostridiales bacterium]